ncbi:hypothetical protein QJR60_07610 [Paraclostridium sordellii]|uniref:hypothetical protein n=1 Tax=Paraclostridium sordellii TaxID=1505 RepID=UPI0030CC0B50
MLHSIGATGFLLALMCYFFKYIKIINKKIRVKLHIYTGMVGALAMILYSLIDFIKEKEWSILLMGFASLLIIISGNDKIRKKYKRLHLISVFIFVFSLIYHIIS